MRSRQVELGPEFLDEFAFVTSFQAKCVNAVNGVNAVNSVNTVNTAL